MEDHNQEGPSRFQSVPQELQQAPKYLEILGYNLICRKGNRKLWPRYQKPAYATNLQIARLHLINFPWSVNSLGAQLL